MSKSLFLNIFLVMILLSGDWKEREGDFWSAGNNVLLVNQDAGYMFILWKFLALYAYDFFFFGFSLC